MSTASNAPTLLTALLSGRLDWGGLQPFPVPDPDERAAADALVDAVGAIVSKLVDADVVDATGQLPPGLLGELQAAGYLRLRNGAEVGGLAASDHTAFRAVERACRVSFTAGQLLAIQNAVGAAALLGALPPGPLRDMVAGRISAGTVSAFAGTEPQGQNNAWPATTAVPTGDGSAYLVTGEKLYAGGAAAADLIALTVTVAEGDERRIAVVFVDAGTPGLEVTAPLEFLGGRGLPTAGLRLDRVRVPREHALVGGPGVPRFPGAVASMALLSSLFFNAAPALATARDALGWSRDFLGRRTINGRPLGGYDRVQRLVTANLADVYAMDSLIRWCLLGCGPHDRAFERAAAKNVCTVTAGRVVDSTLSLLGGEGLETAASKRRRGAPALPVERAYRDVRGTRISGNVDFLLDVQLGRMLLAGPALPPADAGPDPAPAALSAANRAHRAEVADQFRRFAETCRAVRERYPDPDRLAERQHTLGLLGGIAAELVTVTAALARAAVPDGGDEVDRDAAQELADVAATAAGHRLADRWNRLAAPAGPDHAALSRRWLSGSTVDFLGTS